MIFSDFKTLTEVLNAFQLEGHIQSFVEPLPHEVPEHLRQRIDMVCTVGYIHSEGAVAEGLIFPVLQEVWSDYLDVLKVWNRQTFGTENLKGNPDYVITRIPYRGQIRFAPPYVIVVEAKQEKLDEGWAQCLAAMVAAQQLNEPAKHVIYGAVTTGLLWQFGRLSGPVFTQDARSFSITDLDQLCGAIRFVLEQVKHYDVPPVPSVREVA